MFFVRIIICHSIFAKKRAEKHRMISLRIAERLKRSHQREFGGQSIVGMEIDEDEIDDEIEEEEDEQFEDYAYDHEIPNLYCHEIVENFNNYLQSRDD